MTRSKKLLGLAAFLIVGLSGLYLRLMEGPSQRSARAAGGAVAASPTGASELAGDQAGPGPLETSADDSDTRTVIDLPRCR